MPIYWSEFDWQSFATISAGGMAVCGAVYIGRKQVAISAAQTEILRRQSEIASLALKKELFERRYAIFDDTRTFLVEIARHAGEPDSEVQRRFLASRNEARLHFRPEVYDALGRIWERSAAYFATRQAMQESYQRSGDYGRENIQRSSDQFLELTRDLEGLVELFGDELRLSSG